MKPASVIEILVVAGAAALVAVARPKAVAITEAVAETSDSYALPPAHVLPQVSMGYRSALADLLWAHVMVTQGLRMRERRPFDYVVQYMDAISTLDPTFRDPYRLVDTIVAFQSNDPNKVENVRHARRLMELGLQRFPLDAELWLDYGQFLAFVAPSVLPTAAEQQQWRHDGAVALSRLTDLGGSDENTLYKSLAAVRFLVHNGENEAAIRMLEKAYAITDDPDTRDQIEARLRVLLGNRAESQRLLVTRKFEETWRNDLPFVARTTISLIGPPVDTWKCAGFQFGARTTASSCPRDWQTWADDVLGVTRQ